MVKHLMPAKASVLHHAVGTNNDQWWWSEEAIGRFLQPERAGYEAQGRLKQFVRRR
jgi:hypothetical protein